MEGLFGQLVERAIAFGATGTPTVLTQRSDAMVIRTGNVVVKAHRTEATDFAVRLELVAAELHDLFVAPLGSAPWFGTWQGWQVTAWPAGEPVDPEMPWLAPWKPTGQLLARLHRQRVQAPPASTVGRIERAIVELANSEAAQTESGRVVLDAADVLGSIDDPAGRTSLIHGDFHLGQLAHFDARGWLLLDPDDLGRGDARWDFARPAAWFALGLISTEEWTGLVESYRDEGGDAIREWADIDRFAKAFTVHAAARSVCKADAEHRPLNDIEYEFIAACARIAGR